MRLLRRGRLGIPFEIACAASIVAATLRKGCIGRWFWL